MKLRTGVEEHIRAQFHPLFAAAFDGAPINEWELLVLARHYGIPTRLLDWSYSPLIAARFATVNGKHDSDRVVWRPDWRRYYL